MYNTRRTAYLNSCSTAMELPQQNLHQHWQDTEYVGTTCNSDIDNGDMPMYNNDKDDDQYFPEEKRPSRKRANTTSSSGGNEKESKRTANKICRVCGDKAFSYNFNVITCESCKAFFRRNANKEKEIRCPFNEQCEINMVSRRFCQRCRLAKCFTVGMKKEWIMSEEARLEKKQRVEENRERRLQDALNRALEEANMEDDSENSYDEAPPSQQMSVRQYLAADENVHQQLTHANSDDVVPHTSQHHSYNVSDDKMMNYYQDEPSDLGYSNNDYEYSRQMPVSTLPPNPLETTDGVSATADKGASSNLQPPADVESKAVPSSVFLPASISTIQDVAAIISSQGEPTSLGITASDVVDGRLINAAVQAHVINQTQQLAAAVVAQQVVSQMAPVIPPLDPILAPALAIAAAPVIAATPAIQAIQAPIPAPINPCPVNIPIIPKEMPVSVTLLNQLEQSASEMVTVSKDMLVKLIQSSNRTVCTCTCVCGRYPPGSTIVDEVTKDLVNSGSSNSSSAEKDEARLETTEDMQMNGLLPGEANSSIQWLSQQSSAQAVIDPITHSVAEEEHTQRERRDSVFGTFSTAEQAPTAPPKSMNEETFWEHTVAENESRELSDEEVEKMEELHEISKGWTGAGYDSLPILELFKEENLENIVNNLKLLSSFRFLQKRDKRDVVKRGLYNYCVVKWMQHKESMLLDGLSEHVRNDFMKLLKKDEFIYRVQPGAFNALAISVMFHCSSETLISTEVHMEHIIFKKLLDKTLPIKVSSDMVYNNYFPDISRAARHLEKLTGGIPDRLIRKLIS